MPPLSTTPGSGRTISLGISPLCQVAWKRRIWTHCPFAPVEGRHEGSWGDEEHGVGKQKPGQKQVTWWFVVVTGLSREGFRGSRQQSTVSVLPGKINTASCLHSGNKTHLLWGLYSSSQLGSHRGMPTWFMVGLLAQILSRPAEVGMH